ncbi:MAG: HAD-IC family P-type ATPase [Bacteroidia bacterium]
MACPKKPQEKLEIIFENLKTEAPVAMAYDGINDAPALHLADVGISISGASEVARNSAGVILLERAGLKALPQVLKLSRLSLRTIKQNLFWAFFTILLLFLLLLWAFLAFDDCRFHGFFQM